MAYTKLVVSIAIASISLTSLTACNPGKSRKNRDRTDATHFVTPAAPQSPQAGIPKSGVPPQPTSDSVTEGSGRQKVGDPVVLARKDIKSEIFTASVPVGNEQETSVEDIKVISGGSRIEGEPGGREAKSDQYPVKVTQKPDASDGSTVVAGSPAPKKKASPVKPAAKKVAKDESAAESKASACTMNHYVKDSAWFPGLPFQMAKGPRLTLGQEVVPLKASTLQGQVKLVATEPTKAKKSAKSKNAKGKNAKSKDTKPAVEPPSQNGVELRYTDAAVDGLMKVARKKADSILKFGNESRKEFVSRIQDVKFYVEASTGESKLNLVLKDDQNKNLEIALKGEPSGGGHFRLDVVLNQVIAASQKPQFSAVATCDDLMKGCKNALIRLHQLNGAGKVIRVAYLIHRTGPVHVTIGEKDQKLDTISNGARREFVSLLQNTSSNACLNILELASRRQEDQRRDFGACMMERKQSECGKSASPSSGPTAADFVLRTWSVVYGRAGFEWIATNQKVSNMLDYENKDQVVFSISGPLAVTDRRPPQPMIPTYLVRFESANPGVRELVSLVALYANDGGGNLNIHFNFKGSDPSGTGSTRVSLTGLFYEDKIQNSAIDDIRQLTDLAADQFADKVQPGEAAILNGR
jgi:hypothetical protein